MKESDLYSFIFKGNLTLNKLENLGVANISNFRHQEEEKLSKRLSIDFFDTILVARAKKMSIVFIAITSFENTMRDFISKFMLETKGENWWDLHVKPDIQQKVQSRMESEKSIRWHTPRGDLPIYYTEFGNLISIISGNWDIFEAHFQNIDWMKNIITTLERSRNVIMHSGDLSDADIERIGTLIRDWIRQVGL